MARRRFQRGQLIRSGDNWLGRWREDVADDTGAVKRVHKKEVIGTVEEFPTKRLAERELARRLEPINNVEYRPASSITFEQFAKKWKKEIMIHHKPSSQSSDESIIDVHLVPFFGEDQVRNINAEKIQRFVNVSDCAPKTIKNHVSLMMVMWDQVKAWGYAQHNPFPRGTNGRLLLRLPSLVKGKVWNRAAKRWVDGFVFTVEQSLQIIDRATGKWKLLFRILAETGMRPGESAGLLREKCHLTHLSITQSIWQQDVQTPKTENAIRTFAISESLGNDIQQYIAETPDNEYGLLFVSDPSPAKDGRKPRYPGGKPLSMDNFRNRILNPILKDLGILAQVKAMGVRGGNYAFRHMNITELRRMNVPLKTIQKRVGHAIGSDVTDDHYVHAVSSDDRMAAERIGALLASNSETEAVQ